MNIKNIFTVVLLLFVAGSIGYMIVNEKKTEAITAEERVEPAPIAKTQSEDARQDDQLIVYYFHGDKRCPTCHKLENYAKEVLDTYFADEIASKRIVWKIVNVDKTENSHFIRDYKLVTKSIVLSEVANGKEVWWKNLDQIWQKVSDKDGYQKYIHEGVLNGLKDKD